MAERQRREAFRKSVRRHGGGRHRHSGQILGIGDSLREMMAAFHRLLRCLLSSLLYLWDLNPLFLMVRWWRNTRLKQSHVTLNVRPRFRDLISDWFLSHEGRKRKLIQWVHSVLPWLSDDVTDFRASWQDGIVLCALMDTLNPDSGLQVHLLKAHHRVNNCRQGIQMAMAYIHINQVPLSPEEMSLGEEDTEVKLVHLIQLVRWHFLIQGSKVKADTHVTAEEPRACKCEARGTGIKAGIVGKRTKFNLFVDSVKNLHLCIEIKGPNNEYNKETILSMHPRGPSKYRHHMTVPILEDEGKSKVVHDGEGHSFLRQKSLDEGLSHLVIPFDYQCVGEGRFLATYIPRSAGAHYITVLSQGGHIPGSPFEVKVSDWVSSWNLVPKARVMPFDMINHYEDGVKDGTKMGDKVKCKLSSMASVSKQLTMMRKRILKKVITTGGKEIICDVKHTGPNNTSDNTKIGVHLNAPNPTSIQEQGQTSEASSKGANPSQVNPSMNSISSRWRSIQSATLTPPGVAVSNATTSPSSPSSSSSSLPTSSSLLSTATSTAASSSSITSPAISPAVTATSSDEIPCLSREVPSRPNHTSSMEDFKYSDTNVSERWKMAALKVSIQGIEEIRDGSGEKFTNTDAQKFESSSGKLEGSSTGRLESCTSSVNCRNDYNDGNDKHDVSSKPPDCHSKDPEVKETETDSDGVRRGKGMAFPNKTQNPSFQFDIPQEKDKGAIGHLNRLSGEEEGSQKTVNSNELSKCHHHNVTTTLENSPKDSGIDDTPIIAGIESKTGSDKWSLLRQNYLRYLGGARPRREVLGISKNSQTSESTTCSESQHQGSLELCPVCSRKVSDGCTCWVDSGNESNPHCEETDGEEYPLYKFNVDDLMFTGDAISNGLNLRVAEGSKGFIEGLTSTENQQKAGIHYTHHDGYHTSFASDYGNPQTHSLISFRKDCADSGKSDSLYLSKPDYVDCEDDSTWKTLRKAHSFSDASSGKENRGFAINGFQSEGKSHSFDCGQLHPSDVTYLLEETDLGEPVSRKTHYNGNVCSYPRVSSAVSGGKMNVMNVSEQDQKETSTAHSVSIVKNSNMVTSIFYIHKKRHNEAFRSHSFPEDDSKLLVDINNDSDAKVTTETNKTKRQQRFSEVKKIWNSMDEEILDALKTIRERPMPLPPPNGGSDEKVFAEISLKLKPKASENQKGIGFGADYDIGDEEDEDEEVLEVVLEKKNITERDDGLPVGTSDDEESLIPATPSSVLDASLTTSLTTSPTSPTSPTSMSCEECPDCHTGLQPTNQQPANVYGVSPLSLDLNRSDNSDWSDDIVPERSWARPVPRGQIYGRSEWSPRMVDFSPIPKEAMKQLNSTYYVHDAANNHHPSSNSRYTANDTLQQHSGYNRIGETALPKFKITSESARKRDGFSTDESSRKSSWVEDSDNHTEESSMCSLSSSISGEDLSKEDNIVSSGYSKIPAGSWATTQIGSASSHNQGLQGVLNENPKTVLACLRRDVPLVTTQSHTSVCATGHARHPVNRASTGRGNISFGLNYHLKQRKTSTYTNRKTNVLPVVTEDNDSPRSHRTVPKEVCDSLMKQEDEPKNIDFTRDNLSNNDSETNTTTSKRCSDAFQERTLTPTKFRDTSASRYRIENRHAKLHGISANGHSHPNGKGTPRAYDFYWDSQSQPAAAGVESFSDKVLTPTKFRKTTATTTTATTRHQDQRVMIPTEDKLYQHAYDTTLCQHNNTHYTFPNNRFCCREHPQHSTTTTTNTVDASYRFWHAMAASNYQSGAGLISKSMSPSALDDKAMTPMNNNKRLQGVPRCACSNCNNSNTTVSQHLCQHPYQHQHLLPDRCCFCFVCSHSNVDVAREKLRSGDGGYNDDDNDDDDDDDGMISSCRNARRRRSGSTSSSSTSRLATKGVVPSSRSSSSGEVPDGSGQAGGWGHDDDDDETTVTGCLAARSRSRSRRSPGSRDHNVYPRRRHQQTSTHRQNRVGRR